jgi:hypothetical protein
VLSIDRISRHTTTYCINCVAREARSFATWRVVRSCRISLRGLLHLAELKNSGQFAIFSTSQQHPWLRSPITVSCNAIGVTAVRALDVVACVVCARRSRPRRDGGVAELVNVIEHHIFSRFHSSALGLAIGDPSPLGLEGRERQQTDGAWVGNTPGGVIGWGPGAGDDRWLMNSVMVDRSR